MTAPADLNRTVNFTIPHRHVRGRVARLGPVLDRIFSAHAYLAPIGWPSLARNPSLYALFNQGYLAVTFDQAATGERYQGIVPLDGDSIGQAAESYFLQSEQIPSLVRLGIGRDADGKSIGGGLFLQHLPEGEEGGERLHAREEPSRMGACRGARHDDGRRRAR